MPENPDAITLALFLTAAGAPVAAALIAGVVEIAKNLLGGLVSGAERMLAFALSIGIVAVAYVDGMQSGAITLNVASLFAAFLAWYGIGRLALTVHDDATRKANSLTGPSGG